MVATIFLGFIAILLCLIPADKNKGLKWAFFIITLFLSVRYNWGPDYHSYLEEFEALRSHSFDLFDIAQSGSLSTHNEWGWVLLNRLFALSGLGFFGFVIVLSVFESWVMYRMISKYIKPQYYWLAILFYIFSTSFCVNCSMFRQYLSITLFLLVVDLMIEKRVKRYLLISIGLILLASLFHRSVLVTLFSLPLFYINIGKSKAYYLWGVVVAVLFIIWSVLGKSFFESSVLQILESDENLEEYMIYMGRDVNKAETGLGVLFRYIMFAVWLYLLPQFEKRLQPFIILGLFAYFFEIAADVAAVALRLQLYFTQLNLIRWTCFFILAKKRPALYGLFAIEIIILYKGFFEFFTNPCWLSFVEYKTIIEAGSWL